MKLRRIALACGASLTLAISFACGGGGGGSSSPTAAAAPPPVAPVANPDATATYRVTFDSTWSASTHPEGFPSNPHFSPLIGATHLQGTRFWEVGSTASNGIKAMAEQGRTTPLDSEINGAISRGGAETILRGGSIGRSPGRVRLEFEASIDHSYVTLVSMLAPSPDWFAGVSALSLMENGDWADRIDVELFIYDAGTDGGTNYTSSNQPLSPRMPIARLEERPFVVSGSLRSVGTFVFRRLE